MQQMESATPDSSTRKTIPTAKGLPLIGPLLPFLFNPLQYLRFAAQEYGPIFQVKILTQSFVVMSGTDANRFMIEEGRDAITSLETWKDLQTFWQCPRLIIAMDGQEHMDERREFKHYISRDIANSEQSGIVNVIQTFTDQYATGQPVSARTFLRKLVSNELSSLFTGAAMQLPDELSHSIAEYMRLTLSTLMGKRYPPFVLKLPSFRRHEKTVHDFVHTLIARAKLIADEDSFYSFLLKRAGGDVDRAFKEQMPLFLLPFIAGLDTLAATLLFFIHEMVNNPTVLARVVQSIDTACEENNGALPSPAALRQIPALFGVCSETMRRYPVAFANPRHAGKDFTFHGHNVKAGTQVIFFTGAPHFDSGIFKDPDSFDIDRFLEPRQEQKARFAFSPYGRGPHICLGAAMADSLFMTTVAGLLRHYDFTAAIPDKRYKMIFEPGPSLPKTFAICIQKRHL